MVRLQHAPNIEPASPHLLYSVCLTRPKLIEAVLEEVEGAQQEPGAEAARLQRLQRALSGACFRSVCGLCAEEGAPTTRTPPLKHISLHLPASCSCLANQTPLVRVVAVEAHCAVFKECHVDVGRCGCLQSKGCKTWGGCVPTGAVLHCAQCQRSVHTLCLDTPCLSVADLGAEGDWECPCCGQANAGQVYVSHLFQPCSPFMR